MTTHQDANPTKITIRSADEAWVLFRLALEGGDLPERLELVFEGWPQFDMKVNGKDWYGTVPTRVMAPLLDVQRDLHRVYANVCYGTSNLRKLRDEDRDLLELVVTESFKEKSKIPKKKKLPQRTSSQTHLPI